MSESINSAQNKQIQIALLDSGAGGFSILQRLKLDIPQARYLYFYDNAFLPYGTKTDEEIIERCTKITSFLQEKHRPDLYVIACNTASTVALQSLRKHFSAETFVGVVPAIKPAVQLSKNSKIAILATPRTVSGTYLDQLIMDFGAGKKIVKVALPNLVQMVEEHLIGKAQNWTLLSSSLAEVIQQQCDTVVLGCTHFPLVVDQLRVLCPFVVNWVDSADAITRRVGALLKIDEAMKNPQSAQILSAQKFKNTNSICYFSDQIPCASFSVYLKDLELQPFAQIKL